MWWLITQAVGCMGSTFLFSAIRKNNADSYYNIVYESALNQLAQFACIVFFSPSHSVLTKLKTVFNGFVLGERGAW